MGRTIVIGDIHGCFDELRDLLKLVELRTDDRVIAVGDLIVKGAKSREVLDRFIEDARFSSVIGNQDRALRQYWRGEPLRLTKEQKTAAAQLESQRERYAAYLRSLPFAINLGTHLVVHAGVRPGVPLRRQMASDLTEIRTMGANPSSRRGVPGTASIVEKGSFCLATGRRKPRGWRRARLAWTPGVSTVGD
jgi:hypothetical protein